MARSRSKTGAAVLTEAQRVAMAVDLRKQRLPYRVIAERCGYAEESGARKAVERALTALREATAESAEELRQLDLATLDELERMGLEQATKAHGASDGEALAAATLSVIRVQQRRAKLMGLDAAEAFSVTQKTDNLLALDAMITDLRGRLTGQAATEDDGGAEPR